MSHLLRFVSATILMLFILLAGHAAWSNYGAYRELANQVSGGYLLWFAAIIGVSGAYLLLLARIQTERRIHQVAAGFLLLTVMLRLGWIWLFDAQQVNDFADYWFCGEILARGDTSERCAGVYLTRSFFYTFPLRLLFGASQTALELLNVWLISGAALLFYDVARRLFSARVAAGALLFFTWNPDLWYSMTLASPDVPFVFYFSLLLWVLQRQSQHLFNPPVSTVSVGVLSLATGFLIFLIDVQRGFALPIWGGLLLFCLVLVAKSLFSGTEPIHAPKVATGKWFRPDVVWMIVFFVLFPYGVYAASQSAFRHGMGLPASGNSLGYLTAMNVHGSGIYPEREAWLMSYYPRLPEPVRTEFTIRKLLHEITADARETLRYYLRKNDTLALPDGTLWFSAHTAEDSGLGRTNTSHFEEQRTLHRLLSAIFFGLLTLRLLLFPVWGVPVGAYFLLFFTALFYMAILVLTEAQGRYNLFTVFLTSLLVAEIILTLNQRSDRSFPEATAGNFKHLGASLVMGLFGLLGIVGAFVFNAAGLAGTSHTLVDLSNIQTADGQLVAEAQPVAVPASRLFSGSLITPGAKVEIQSRTIGYNQLQFWLARNDPRRGDYAAISIPLEKLPTDQGCLLELVISNPYQNRDETGRLVWQIDLDGQLLAEEDISLNKKPIRYLIHWTPRTTTAELIIRVVAQVDTEPWDWGYAGRIQIHQVAVRPTLPTDALNVTRHTPASVIVNNSFKELALDLSLAELLENDGQLTFRKPLSLFGRQPYTRLQFFASVDATSQLLPELSDMDLKLFLNDQRVLVRPLNQIGHLNFIDHPIHPPYPFGSGTLTIRVDGQRLLRQQPTSLSDQTLSLKIEYLSIQ